MSWAEGPVSGLVRVIYMDTDSGVQVGGAVITFQSHSRVYFCGAVSSCQDSWALPRLLRARVHLH